jgi:hypothetical protein
MQLDALKAYPNVLVLTTSNITEAIDLAFVDRADIKAYIGPPGLKVWARVCLLAHVAFSGEAILTCCMASTALTFLQPAS